jgi:hypothetical protein
MPVELPKERFSQPLTVGRKGVAADFDRRFKQLYEDAAKADVQLGAFMTEVCKPYVGVKIEHAKLKKEETARAKCVGRGGPPKDPDFLMDISRARIVCKDMETMMAISEDIKAKPECRKTVDRYEDRWAEKSGYQDVKFFLEFKVGDHGHFCELQLNADAIDKACPLNHPVYEIVRLSGSEEDARDVRLPQPMVKKYGPELRRLWVWMKQRHLADKALLREFKQVVRIFYKDDDLTRLLQQNLTVRGRYHIPVLRKLSPIIYETHYNIALQAYVVKGGELWPIIPAPRRAAHLRAMNNA